MQSKKLTRFFDLFRFLFLLRISFRLASTSAFTSTVLYLIIEAKTEGACSKNDNFVKYDLPKTLRNNYF